MTGEWSAEGEESFMLSQGSDCSGVSDHGWNYTINRLSVMLSNGISATIMHEEASIIKMTNGYTYIRHIDNSNDAIHFETREFVGSGHCEVYNFRNYSCISSKNYPMDYGILESCEFVALRNGTIFMNPSFEVQSGYDFLIVDGTSISNADAFPISVRNGSRFSWNTDRSKGYKGWEMCFQSEMYEDPFIGDNTVSCGHWPSNHPEKY